MAHPEAGITPVTHETFAQFSYDPEADVLSVRALTSNASRQEGMRYVDETSKVRGLDWYSDSARLQADILVSDFMRGAPRQEGASTAGSILAIVEKVSSLHRDKDVDLTLGWIPNTRNNKPSVEVYPSFQYWLNHGQNSHKEALLHAQRILDKDIDQQAVGMKGLFVATLSRLRGKERSQQPELRSQNKGRVYISQGKGSRFNLVRSLEAAGAAGHSKRSANANAEVDWNIVRVSPDDAICEPVRARAVRVGENHHALYRMDTIARTDDQRLQIALVLGVLARSAHQASKGNEAELLFQDVEWVDRPTDLTVYIGK